MLGVIVNAGAIVLGSLIGLLLKKGMPEKISDAVMIGLGLCVTYIGISGSLSGQNVLIVICAMVIGAIVGTAIDIDDKFNKLGWWVEARLNRGEEGAIAKGFITASLAFCVGAMAVVGSLNSGLRGDHQVLFTKSLLDFVGSIMFAASLGIGVALSGVAVLIYQGAIALLAGFLEPFLNEAAIAEMTCAGSLLIMVLGLNMIGVTKIKVANYLPALVAAPIICAFVELMSKLLYNI